MAERTLLKIICLFAIVFFSGFIVFMLSDFKSQKEDIIGSKMQKMRISVPKEAPAALSGKWKLIK